MSYRGFLPERFQFNTDKSAEKCFTLKKVGDGNSDLQNKTHFKWRAAFPCGRAWVKTQEENFGPNLTDNFKCTCVR